MIPNSRLFFFFKYYRIILGQPIGEKVGYLKGFKCTFWWLVPCFSYLYFPVWKRKDFRRTMLKVLKINFPHLFQVLSISKLLDFERKSALYISSAKSLVQIL